MQNVIRVMSKSIIFRNVEVSFSNEVKLLVNELFDKYLNLGLEVGGYFFSTKELENKYHCDWVSKPNDKDIFKSTYYELNLDEENNNINKYCKNKFYLCIWHSHRECSIKESSIDIDNAKNILIETKSNVIFSLIFNKKYINILAFYIHNGKIKYKRKKIIRGKLW